MTDEHSRYEDLICRLPDGGLSSDEKKELQAHLNTCPDCRRLFFAMRELTEELDSLAAPPPSLAEGVMARIGAETKTQTKGSGPRIDTNDRRAADRRRRMQRSLGALAGIAAVCVLILGGGLFAAKRLFSRAPASEAVLQSVSMDTGLTGSANSAAGLTVPAAEAAPALFDTVQEAADAEYAAEKAAPPENVSARRSEYTLDAPARIPEGREADFEALLEDVGSPDGESAGCPCQVIAYVEYRGVIYEFLSEETDGELLLWRDAAEGADPMRSPASPAALWDIIR